jgi:predicted SnoaL-like aldol condensation-catalyzing enzyme
MPHGHSKKGEKGGHGGISLMSILVNMILDLVINRKVNKAAKAVNDDPRIKQHMKDIQTATDKVKLHFEEWCKENPEECDKLKNDPELGGLYR